MPDNVNKTWLLVEAIWMWIFSNIFGHTYVLPLCDLAYAQAFGGERHFAPIKPLCSRARTGRYTTNELRLFITVRL